MPWRYSGFSREAPRHHHCGSIRKRWVRCDELRVKRYALSHWRRGRHQPKTSQLQLPLSTDNSQLTTANSPLSALRSPSPVSKSLGRHHLYQLPLSTDNSQLTTANSPLSAVRSPLSFPPSPSLQDVTSPHSFLKLEADRNRPIIYQFHLHIRCKDAAFHMQTSAFKPRNKHIEELGRFDWHGSIEKIWTPPT